jgi:hypothetical protein
MIPNADGGAHLSALSRRYPSQQLEQLHALI